MPHANIFACVSMAIPSNPNLIIKRVDPRGDPWQLAFFAILPIHIRVALERKEGPGQQGMTYLEKSWTTLEPSCCVPATDH